MFVSHMECEMSKIKRFSNVSRFDFVLKVLMPGVQIHIKNRKHNFCLRDMNHPNHGKEN